MNPDRDFLLDIVELIETIERHRPETEHQLVEDEVLLTAAIHWVQTIGEAANGVSERLRTEHPQVPWRQIVDMRHLRPTVTDLSTRRSCGRSWFATFLG